MNLNQRSPQNVLNKDFSLSFRMAEENDVYQYFFWTNDPETRKQSFNSDIIPLKSHATWFKDKLASDNCLMLVMKNETNDLGQIRFEVDGQIAITSFSLDRNYRGRGLSKRLVTGGIEKLKEQFADLKEIHAFVKASNIPSKKSFLSLDFEQENVEETDNLKFIYQINS